MTDVVILGVGGNSVDIAETLATAAYDDHRLLGYLDDDPLQIGRDIYGVPVLGPLELAHRYPDAWLILALGSPRSFSRRLPLLQELGLQQRRFLTVVHPTARVSPHAVLGQGTVLLSFVEVSNGARLDGHNIVLSHTVINHDTVLGPGTLCASSVTLSGGVTVGSSCYLGAGTVIRDGVTLGDGVLTGAGAVVVCDLPSAGVFVGNPARALERR